MTTPLPPSPGPFEAATDSPPEAPHVPAQRAGDPRGTGRGDLAPVPTYPPPGLPPPAARESRRRKPLFKILLLIGVAAVILAGAVGWQVARHLTYEPTPRAAVGECLVGAEPKHMRKVGCADAGARWKVLGRVDDITEGQFQAKDVNVCSAYPTAEFTFWEAAAREGARGYALCLGPVQQ